MDQITDVMEMVDHVPHPAFCVKEGSIVKINPAAAARMIETGTAVSALLHTGQEEYEEFSGGCLYLTLELFGQTFGASVVRKTDFDLFILDPDADRSDLQALALAARELREPLSRIMITADRLFPVTEPQNDEARDQMARINRGLAQLHRIINNMADASRFAADNGSRQEVRDVCAVIGEIIAKAAALAEYNGVRVEYEAYPNPVYSLVDEGKLERAILNIISNALKFTPKGSSIQVTLTRRENRLYLSIQDNGCGIPENLRGSIFCLYTREPGLEDQSGIGLGLVLVRSTAALHGGTVLVDHPRNEGTRITMTMAIRGGSGKELRSPVLKVDYAGERDHWLLELADVLPVSLYDPQKYN